LISELGRKVEGEEANGMSASAHGWDTGEMVSGNRLSLEASTRGVFRLWLGYWRDGEW